jgi:glucokinase
LDAACIAVAGPVFDGEARLTNAVGMTFSASAVRTAVATERVALVNDMVALGSAVAALPTKRFECLGGTAADGVKGVVAAGTGLGMGIVWNGQCLPSEGGHARVAPVGAFERELLAATEAEADSSGEPIAWEHYLSGRGVETLHRAVSAVWGTPSQPLAAEEITQRGTGGEDPVCHTTVETWAGMMATAVGGLAVQALATGGVYLDGSVVHALAAQLRLPSFRRRLREAAWAADFLADVPVYLVPNDGVGLDGAAEVARRSLLT